VHGLSQKEVARRLGVSENTVEKHVGKALAILTRKVGHGGTERFESSKQSDRVNITPANRAARKRGRH
jgi:transposase